MKRRETVVFGVLLLFFLSLFVSAQIRVFDLRSDLRNRLHVSAAPIPPELLKALAGEFKGLVADYLLLEAASFIGGNSSVNDAQWDAVARLLEQSSVLDPYFKQTYILAQGTLPWQGHKLAPAMAILERSKVHRTWDWRPGFLLGFNNFYFLKDNLKASHELMQASKIPGAPLTLATWASRLASQAGQTSAAIEFLLTIHEGTEDETFKKQLEARIEALRGVETLQFAVDRFQVRFSRSPNSLNELVEASILPDLPRNPYKRPYSLSEGKVDF